jgi:hypothetical protein
VYLTFEHISPPRLSLNYQNQTRDLSGGYMAVYIRGSINSGPSDQTDLKGWCRCNLGGGGEPTFEAETDPWIPQASRPSGGASRPPISVMARSSVSCLLDASRVFPSWYHHG